MIVHRHLVFRNESMSDFAWTLSRMAGLDERIVVDRTGLKGRFDFNLEFQPQRRSTTEPGELTSPDGPSIFIALQQQLGLRLISIKAPVEFLVVEHVQRPTEN